MKKSLINHLFNPDDMTTLHPKQVKEIKRKRRRLLSRANIRVPHTGICFGAFVAPNKRKFGFKIPWVRDGHESEVHYLVKHKLPAMLDALKYNIKDHPFYAAAVEAKKLKLI